MTGFHPRRRTHLVLPANSWDRAGVEAAHLAQRRIILYSILNFPEPLFSPEEYLEEGEKQSHKDALEVGSPRGRLSLEARSFLNTCYVPGAFQAQHIRVRFNLHTNHFTLWTDKARRG